MKVFLIHFQPPEYYPPLINICDFLSQNLENKNLALYTNSVEGIKVNLAIKNAFRIIKLKKKDFKVQRFFKIIYFNLFVTFQLFKVRPSSIIYFETASSLPSFLYLLFYSKRTRLFIHYHEYTSLTQYKRGMFLERIWHNFEINFLYRKAFWISQTNQYRIKFFLRDYSFINSKVLKVLPNFPPRSWIVPLRNAQERMKSTPFRIIQVGSISILHMYAKELFDWVEKMNGLFLLDIYSFKTQPDVVSYLEKLNCPFIQLKGSIEYSKIPEILSAYDIGVVLYKANSENVIYCASNKLFEYLACGLDVWVSNVMIGSTPYLRSKCFPKVSFIDFENLSKIDWKYLINRDNLNYQPSEYYMELVYNQLLEHLQ